MMGIGTRRRSFGDDKRRHTSVVHWDTRTGFVLAQLLVFEVAKCVIIEEKTGG